VNQIRLCCNRAFLTFESYIKHKAESPYCSPGIVLEQISRGEQDDGDEEPGLFPIIQSVSSVADSSWEDESEDNNGVQTDGEASSMVSGVTTIEAIETEATRLSRIPAAKRNQFQKLLQIPPVIDQQTLVDQTLSTEKKSTPDLSQDFSEEEEEYPNVYKCNFENCVFAAETEGGLDYHSKVFFIEYFICKTEIQ